MHFLRAEGCLGRLSKRPDSDPTRNLLTGLLNRCPADRGCSGYREGRGGGSRECIRQRADIG